MGTLWLRQLGLLVGVIIRGRFCGGCTRHCNSNLVLSLLPPSVARNDLCSHGNRGNWLVGTTSAWLIRQSGAVLSDRQLGGFVRIDDSVRDGCYCRCNEALSWLTGVVRY